MGKIISVAEQRALKKSDYELLFKDSAESFVVKNAKMIQEGSFVRFVSFDENDVWLSDEWYSIANIHRIKRYK